MLTREGSRPHRVRVTSYDESLARVDSRLLDLGDEPVRLGDAAVVVPNSAGETFARIRLDDRSWEAVERDLASIPDDDTRAVLWSAGFDLVRCGELPATDVPRPGHPAPAPGARDRASSSGSCTGRSRR